MNKIYNSEEEFLKEYDPSSYDRFSITTDILIFSVSSENTENYRKTDEKKMSILLVKRLTIHIKTNGVCQAGLSK